MWCYDCEKAAQRERTWLDWNRHDRAQRVARDLWEVARAQATAREQLVMAGCDDPGPSRFHGSHQDESDRAQKFPAQFDRRGTSARARARRYDDIDESCCEDRMFMLDDGGYCGNCQD